MAGSKNGRSREEIMAALVLHEYAASGNCYKIRLTAAHLGLPLERREYDIVKGETRTPEFLGQVNANGRIPVLQLGTDDFLPESNAACFYLADGSDLIPHDRFARADMLRWLFWEQYNHEPNVATLRFWTVWIGLDNLSEVQRAMLPAKRAVEEGSRRLIGVQAVAPEAGGLVPAAAPAGRAPVGVGGRARPVFPPPANVAGGKLAAPTLPHGGEQPAALPRHIPITA